MSRIETAEGLLVGHNGLPPTNMKLLRFENLRADVNAMHEELGTPYRLPAKGGSHVNKAIRKPYPEYYTPATRDLIGQLYARDAELFGYSFDDYERWEKEKKDA